MDPSSPAPKDPQEGSTEVSLLLRPSARASQPGGESQRARSPAQAATRLRRVQLKEAERRVVIEEKWHQGLELFFAASSHLNQSDQMLNLKREEVTGRKVVKSLELVFLFEIFEECRRSEIEIDEISAYYVGGPEPWSRPASPPTLQQQEVVDPSSFGASTSSTIMALRSGVHSASMRSAKFAPLPPPPTPPPLYLLKVEEVVLRLNLLQQTECSARALLVAEEEEAGSGGGDRPRQLVGEGGGSSLASEAGDEAAHDEHMSPFRRALSAIEQRERQYQVFKEARSALEDEQLTAMAAQVTVPEQHQWVEEIFGQRKKAFQGAVDAAFYRLRDGLFESQTRELGGTLAVEEAASWINDIVAAALQEQLEIIATADRLSSHKEVFPQFTLSGCAALEATETSARRIVVNEQDTLVSSKMAIQRGELVHLKRVSAVPLIQQHVRRHQARAKLDKVLDIEGARRRVAAASLCQMLLQGQLSGIETRQRQHCHAVRLICRVTAGFHLRLHCAEKHWRRRRRAAAHLQQVGRGWLMRETVAEVWQEKLIDAEEIVQLQTTAIQQIQWAGRSYLAARQSHKAKVQQRRLREKKAGTLISQQFLYVRAATLGVAARREQEYLRKIVKIQSVFRCFGGASSGAGVGGGRIHMGKLYRITMVQAALRKKLSMVVLFLKQVNHPARRIQRAARVMLANRKVSRARTIRDQNIRFRKQHNAAIRIQSLARTWSFHNTVRIQLRNTEMARRAHLEDVAFPHVDRLQKMFRGTVQGRIPVSRLYQAKVQRITLVQIFLRGLRSSIVANVDRGIPLYNHQVNQLEQQNAQRIHSYVTEVLDTTYRNIAATARLHQEKRLAALHDVIERFIRQRQAVTVVSARKVVVEGAAQCIQLQWQLAQKRRDAKLLLVAKRQIRREQVRDAAATKVQKVWRHRTHLKRSAALLIQSTFLRLLPTMRRSREQRMATKRLHELRRRGVFREWMQGHREVRRLEGELWVDLLKRDSPAAVIGFAMNGLPSDSYRSVPLTMTSPQLLWTTHEDERRRIEGQMIKGLLRIRSAMQEDRQQAEFSAALRCHDASVASLLRTQHIECRRIQLRELVTRRSLRSWLHEALAEDFHALEVVTIRDPEQEQRRHLLDVEYEESVAELHLVCEQLVVLHEEKRQHAAAAKKKAKKKRRMNRVGIHDTRDAVVAAVVGSDGGSSTDDYDDDVATTTIQQRTTATPDEANGGGLDVTGANLPENDEEEEQGLAVRGGSTSGEDHQGFLSSLVPKMVVEHLRGFAVVNDRGVQSIPQADLEFILWGKKDELLQNSKKLGADNLGGHNLTKPCPTGLHIDPSPTTTLPNVALVVVLRSDAGAVTIRPLFPVQAAEEEALGFAVPPGVNSASPLDGIIPDGEEEEEEETAEKEKQNEGAGGNTAEKIVGEPSSPTTDDRPSSSSDSPLSLTTGVRDNSLPQIFNALCGMGVITSISFPSGSYLTTAGLVSLLNFLVVQDIPLSVLDLSGSHLLDDAAALHCVRALKTIPTLREVVLTGAGLVSLRKRQMLRQSIQFKEEQRQHLLRRGSIGRNRLMVGVENMIAVNSTVAAKSNQSLAKLSKTGAPVLSCRNGITRPTLDQQAAAALGAPKPTPRQERQQAEDEESALLVPVPRAQYRQRVLLFPRRNPVNVVV